MYHAVSRNACALPPTSFDVPRVSHGYCVPGMARRLCAEGPRGSEAVAGMIR
jgi:hypothetical protein